MKKNNRSDLVQKKWVMAAIQGTHSLCGDASLFIEIEAAVNKRVSVAIDRHRAVENARIAELEAACAACKSCGRLPPGHEEGCGLWVQKGAEMDMACKASCHFCSIGWDVETFEYGSYHKIPPANLPTVEFNVKCRASDIRKLLDRNGGEDRAEYGEGKKR